MDSRETPLSLWATSPRALPYLQDLFASVQAEIVREARTMWGHFVGHMWVLHTDTRWIGTIDKDVMWFNHQDTALCRVIWETHETISKAYQGYLYGSNPFPLERDLVEAVISILRLEGWACACEVATVYGRIDILAIKEPVVWVIEAKLTATAQTLEQALGQLLAGHAAYPAARLGLVTTDHVPTHWLTLLQSYDINLVEGPWTKQTA